MSGVLRLKATDMGKLVHYIPFLLDWLKQNDEYAGELFLGSALDIDDDEVHATLAKLLESNNKNGNLNSNQLKEICQGHPLAVWARCVHTLFTSASPKIIPEATSDQLLARSKSLHPGEDPQKVVDILKTDLDRLPRTSFEALGKLCVLIRDTCEDPDLTALAMGSTIFVGHRAPDAARKLSGLVFQLMINNAEAVFSGVSAEPIAVSPPDMPFDISSFLENRTERRTRTLKEFLEWREPGSADVADKLLEYFDFVEVAQGLQLKYSALPNEWTSEIAEMKKQGVKGLKWFDNAKTYPPNRLSLLPRIFRKPNERKSKKLATVDRIINEIVATEAFYFDTMKDMADIYVKEIQMLCDGKKGPENMRELGMTSSQVAEVFGSRLENVLDVSTHLLNQLNLVSIVTSAPTTSIGRAGIIANIFAEHASELKVYAPYISSHMAAIKTLKACLTKVERAEKLKASSSAKKLLGGGQPRESQNSFINVWYRLSQTSPYLKGQTIESVLIQPVQRVPRYKLLIETLMKDCAEDHPAYALLQSALNAVKKAATQINSAVKQHMKLENLFGQDTMLNPNSSKAKVDEDGNFLAIVNSYIG